MSIVDSVRAAGVVGAGGAGFPTHVKLNGKAEYVIANGAECEPYLTGDHRMMVENPKAIIDGARIAAYILGAKKI